MTSSLIPLNGGVETLTTTVEVPRNSTYSPQYIRLNNLETRPTEWVPEGRPIYGRLPKPNEIFEGSEDVGYVYIPYGEGIFGSISLEVESSPNKKDISIKGGVIVWKYGRSVVLPVLVNLEDLQITSARYFVGYELLYDKEPQPFQYRAQDYQLSGLPLTLTSSTDNILGWRYGAKNAFTEDATYFWNNQDSFFPTYSQPTQSFLTWETSLPQAYKVIRIKLPSTTYVPPNVNAIVHYLAGSTWEPVASSTPALVDGQYTFEITIPEPQYQQNWKIEWRNSQGNVYLPIAVESISVDGVVTLERTPASAVPRASLVIYPENTVPKDGFFCQLAYVDVNNAFEVTEVVDLREIVHQDYTPVSDWLTKPWDDNLINLYSQVKNFDKEWMSPITCMDQEYINLEKSGITVEK